MDTTFQQKNFIQFSRVILDFATIIQHPHLPTKEKKNLGLGCMLSHLIGYKNLLFPTCVLAIFVAWANGKGMNYGCILVEWGYLFMPPFQLVYKEIEQ